MSLLDDVIVNAASAVCAVGKKASEVVDKSKLRISTAELKKKISDKFETLGRYVYDTNVSGTADAEIISKYCEEITVLISELKTLQDALNEANDKVVCPKCDCSNSLDSLYCKKCGSSLDFSNSYTPKTDVVSVDEIKAENSEADTDIDIK